MLGVTENASDRQITEAFRRLSREKHPDRNRGDEERATSEFQKLTQAKIVLLDPEQRKKHDEELVDSGTRNRDALPLLCSICADETSKGTHGKFALRCLKGFGHKSPLIEEFHAAAQEYHSWKMKKSNINRDESEYIGSLQKVLKNFVDTDWSKLYPLAKARKTESCSDEKDPPMPNFIKKILQGCSTLGENQASGMKARNSFTPPPADIIKLFDACLARGSKKTIGQQPSSHEKFPMYDLSSLLKSELEQIYQYFGLSYDRSASHELLARNLDSFIPTVQVEQVSSDEECGNVCQRCGARKFFFSLSSFTACFICRKACCQRCFSQSKRKVPSSGSFNLRPICRKCLTNTKSKEAESWLKLGQSLLHTSETSRDLETVLAMYRMSYDLDPSEDALIAQAQAMFHSKKHARLVDYGGELLRTRKLQQKNAQIIQHRIAESLLQIAHDADDSDLLAKVDKYEETVNWIESFRGEGEAAMHDIKVTATKGRLDCIQECERMTSQIASKSFSRLVDAIRKGSLIEMVAILEYEDEEVVNECLKKLSKESTESFVGNAKLLLDLGQATAKLTQNDPTSAVNQVADVFWNGYALFQAKENNMSITDYVVYFTCLLHKCKYSLPLEEMGGITVHNLLECLQLSEDDLLSPPDIDSRKWENLDVTGCNMKMFSKYELAVKKLVQTNKWSPVDAALSYYDLITACNHPSQLLTVLITSAQWFARQMSRPSSDKALQYQCRKMTLKLTNLAAALAFEFGVHPYQQFYVARMVLGLQFYAFTKTMFGSQEDVESIGVLLKSVVAAGRLCPLHKMPIVTPTESVLLYFISQELYCDYLLELQDEIPPELRPMSEAILRYQIYENHWLKRCRLQDSTESLRLAAMSALLAEERLSWDDVQRRLQSSMIALDSEGWLVNNCKLLGPVASSGIQKLVGLEINKKDFSIHLLIEKALPLSFLNRKPPLLSWQDVATGLIMDSPGSFFSLESVSPEETHYHPFNKMIFSPDDLEGSPFLFSMFHTDYLLKQMSMGFEMQSYPPFQKRPIFEGLLKDLPDKLKEVLLPIPSRGFSRSRVHRLWIQADDMEYDVQEDEHSIRWIFGEVNIAVRCMPMFHTKDGQLQDQNVQGPDDDSPEGRFVADFTKNYDEIGKYFPEFLRLKELCKVQFLGSFIKSFEEALVAKKRELKSKEMDAKYAQIYDSTLRDAENQICRNLDKVERQVSYINDDVVQQVRQAGISASDSEIYDWLRYGDSGTIVQSIAKEKVPSIKQIRQKIIADHTKNLQTFQTNVANFTSSSKTSLSSSNECRWVPAVCHSTESQNNVRCFYGGVSLTPKAQKVSIPLQRFFSGIKKISLTSSLFRNDAKPPQPKKFNPPKINGKKLISKDKSGSGSSSSSGGDPGSGDMPSGKGGTYLV